MSRRRKHRSRSDRKRQQELDRLISQQARDMKLDRKFSIGKEDIKSSWKLKLKRNPNA